jgi:hypothetical protein
MTSELDTAKRTWMTDAIAAVMESRGRLTEFQKIIFVATYRATLCEPWWKWTSYLAAAIACRKHGMEPS